MKKAIKYSILSLAALCTLLLCGGYYMLGYSLKPDDLVSRSRNIAASYDFMYERYPELHPWVDSLMTAGALKDFYIENDRGETLACALCCRCPPYRQNGSHRTWIYGQRRAHADDRLFVQQGDGFQYPAARPLRTRDERRKPCTDGLERPARRVAMDRNRR